MVNHAAVEMLHTAVLVHLVKHDAALTQRAVTDRNATRAVDCDVPWVAELFCAELVQAIAVTVKHEQRFGFGVSHEDAALGIDAHVSRRTKPASAKRADYVSVLRQHLRAAVGCEQANQTKPERGVCG